MRFLASKFKLAVLQRLCIIEAQNDLIIKQNWKIMENASSLSAKVDTVVGDIATIKTNVAAIRAGLPVAGGMTQAEVDALGAKLDTAVSAADAEVADTAAPVGATGTVTQP